MDTERQHSDFPEEFAHSCRNGTCVRPTTSGLGAALERQRNLAESLRRHPRIPATAEVYPDLPATRKEYS